MTETISPKPDACQLERLSAFLRLIPEGGALDRLLKGAALLEDRPTTAAELASDVLYGAGAIAAFIWGHEKHRCKVYRLVEASKLPHFRLGTNICSRRSVLKEWIANQERMALRRRDVAG